MNSPSNQGPNPHPPHNRGHHPQQGGYPQEPAPGRGSRGDGANTVANIIRSAVGVVVTVFALHVLFVVFDANQGNEFVSVVYALAQTLVLGLGDVFTPEGAVLGVVLNYGLAALIYLVVGQLIIKALRSR
ncbi:hypothetical protein FHX42_004841 [Saccharopolyspora lacisalsi]|uniref:Uncharacterized protein n=1 Tax=Halosaccharopolyspora lacisalsi TaxID=1000566 RepID=A0A839E6E3_9PSEU|nr:hypothetical protein [Halosaccharopolyspora lacisalsi]MBA8827445.1 hypothetical protein [Halosaccharopolyspora lacisalsi]